MGRFKVSRVMPGACAGVLVLCGCVPVPVLGGSCEVQNRNVDMDTVCAELVTQYSHPLNDPGPAAWAHPVEGAPGWKNTGDVAPPLRVLRSYVKAKYPGVVVGGVRKDSLRFHPMGRAIDVMIPAGDPRGAELLEFLLQPGNWKKYRLYNIIYGNYVYSPRKQRAEKLLAAAHQSHLHIAVVDSVEKEIFPEFGESIPGLDFSELLGGGAGTSAPRPVTGGIPPTTSHTASGSPDSGSGSDGVWVEVVKHRPTVFTDAAGNTLEISWEDQDKIARENWEMCAAYLNGGMPNLHAGGGGDLAGTSNVKGRKGLLLMPLNPMPRPSSPFGYRIHPISGKRKLHTGVDYPAPQGSTIFSVAGGKIKHNGYDPSCGNGLGISHGLIDGHQYETWYCHMASRSPLPVGASVTAGQAVGLVGSTGSSTGPHLHIELRIDGKLVNPAEWF